QSHEPVAQILVHRAVVAMDCLGDELQNLTQDLVDSLWIKPLRQRGRVEDVGEQYRDELSFSLQRTARDENFLLEMAWRGRRGHPRRSRSRAVERGAALAAELRLWWIRHAASGTRRQQWRPALIAELGLSSVRVPTMRAKHGSP